MSSGARDRPADEVTPLVVATLREAGARFAFVHGSRARGTARQDSDLDVAVVDEVRVLRLLRAVADDLAVLRAEAAAPAERRADPLWLRGVKYTFVTAIEACIDAAQHICAAEGWGPPRDNGEAVDLLARHGVLPADLAQRVRRAVGFRDVLVHDYVRVDDAVVLARLQDVSDLDEFAAAVAGWLPGEEAR